MTHPIVIIGTGWGGYLLAKAWRQHDTTTPLVLLTEDGGEFYSKPMLSTSLDQKRPEQAWFTSTASHMQEQLCATIHTHTMVRRVDTSTQTIYSDQQTPLHYQKLVLACGSALRPITMQVDDDIRKEACVSVNTLDDYRHFRTWLAPRKSIAVVGSGLLGLEFAYDLSCAGYSIDVISLDTRPLQRFLPPMAGQAVYHMIAACFPKIRWHWGCTIDQLKQQHSDDLYQLTLSGGHTCVVNGVLLAVGLEPRIDLAHQMGLEVHEGIVVDHMLKTSIENVYALGDCAQVCGHIRHFIPPIRHASTALAKNLMGEEQKVHYPAMLTMLKTKHCPVVFSLPAEGVQGNWKEMGEGHDVRSLLYDSENTLRGFALTGSYTTEKMSWLHQLPDLF